MTKRAFNMLALKRDRKNVVLYNGAIHALTRGSHFCPDCSVLCNQGNSLCWHDTIYKRMTKRWAKTTHG
jgi:hypothetical protein